MLDEHSSVLNFRRAIQATAKRVYEVPRIGAQKHRIGIQEVARRLTKEAISKDVLILDYSITSIGCKLLSAIPTQVGSVLKSQLPPVVNYLGFNVINTWATILREARNHSLRWIFAVTHPKSDLIGQNYRAEVNATMLLMLIKLLRNISIPGGNIAPPAS